MPSKQALFRQGVAAATRVLGTTAAYACPLCANLFVESALGTGELTGEDVPPKALGGKRIILTCKRCNNTSGHSIDAEAAKRLRQRRSFDALVRDRKGYAGRGLLRLEDTQIVVDLSVDSEDTRELKVVASSNNPVEVERFERQFNAHIDAGTTDGLEMQYITYDGFKTRWAWISDLRSAFLVCTAAIGYRFGLHEVLKPIREQILQPDKEILSRWWFRSQKAHPPQTILFSDIEGIAIVNLSHASIALPSPSRPPDRYYALLDALVQKRQFSMTGFTNIGSWPTSFEARLDHTHT